MQMGNYFLSTVTRLLTMLLKTTEYQVEKIVNKVKILFVYL
jgi:hypothetical protein